MEDLVIRAHAVRVSSKNQESKPHLIAVQRDDALLGNGGPMGSSVWKQRKRGARFSRRHGAMPGIVLVLLTFAGWCQHIYTCFVEDLWGFLIAGAILSPIGIINGWGIWFGWW
jgi:hypothetical protein